MFTELSGTTVGIQGETGQRVSTANFFLAPRKVGDPHVPPALFGPTVGIQGKTGQRGSAAYFFLAPRKAGDPKDGLPAGATARTGPPALAMGTPYKKEAAIAQGAQERGCYHPWRPWGDPFQSSRVAGVVWFYRRGKFSGKNRTARKRCQFFAGPRMPAQKRGCYRSWRPWGEA